MFNALATAVAGVGTIASSLYAPFEKTDRYDYALATARTRGGTLWSKAMAAGVADVYPRLSPGTVSARTFWASRYIWAINTHRKRAVIVYVCNYALHDFFGRVLPHLAKPVVLIVGDGDAPVFSLTFPPGHLGRDTGIAAVFAQNLDTIHPRAFPLPLGLDFHSVHRGTVSTWGMPSGQSPQDQEDEMLSLRRAAPPWAERVASVYVQFNAVSNVVLRTQCLRALSRLSSSHVEPESMPRAVLWRRMRDYRFVASPFGNGLDCHRTWEALVLGCVPIVLRVPAMSPLFEGLPVWEVDDYAQVTEATLAEKSREIGANLDKGAYDRDKLTIPWWRNHIHETVARLDHYP